jgi:hypothetical protein
MVVSKNEEHVYSKHRRVSKRSPCVLRNSAILRWQFFIIDERKKLIPYRFRTVADDLHLGKRRSGQNRLEEPEDPRHKRGDIHEKLASLVRTVSVCIGVSKMTPRHTHEEFRIMVLKYGRDRRGSSFRVCSATAEGHTFIIYFYWSVDCMYAEFSTYRVLESSGQRIQNLLV